MCDCVHVCVHRYIHMHIHTYLYKICMHRYKTKAFTKLSDSKFRCCLPKSQAFSHQGCSASSIITRCKFQGELKQIDSRNKRFQLSR